MLPCRLVLVLVASATLLLADTPAHAQEKRELTATEQAAQATVEEWLRHVEGGAWETAWDAAAPGLRDSVSQEQWQTRGTRVHEALGPVHSRQLTRVQYRDTLRQASETGPVVVLQYHSTFGTDLYVETVLALRTEEAWRVAGYEIAPVAGHPGKKSPH